jgi:hypothetical protein
VARARRTRGAGPRNAKRSRTARSLLCRANRHHGGQLRDRRHGSLLVTAAPTRPRALSLLSSVHIALLFATQIRPTLGAAFALLEARDELPSGAHVITGPSRTSDIENDLTIGVHGPSAVTRCGRGPLRAEGPRRARARRSFFATRSAHHGRAPARGPRPQHGCARDSGRLGASEVAPGAAT